MALTLCLGQPADVYLIDEPSAYLDAEQRVHAAKVIKRYAARARLLSLEFVLNLKLPFGCANK